MRYPGGIKQGGGARLGLWALVQAGRRLPACPPLMIVGILFGVSLYVLSHSWRLLMGDTQIGSFTPTGG